MHTRSTLQRLPLAVALLPLAAVLVAGGAQPVTLAQQAAPRSDALEVLEVRPNFYAIFGAGGNIGVQIGQQGVVLVDAGTAGQTDAVLAEIKKLTPRPIRFIINTSPDADHVGGDEAISGAGQAVHSDEEFINIGPFFGGRGNTTGAGRRSPAVIVAHEALFLRALGDSGLPLEAFPGARRDLFLNDEAIEILHQPAARTDGDSFVFFRRSDVVVAGDIVDFRRFPDIDLARGGSVQGEIDALNRLILLTVPPLPLHWLSGGTIVIPGHGRLADENTVVEYRDMMVIIRDRIQDLINKGQTLQQITAANPTDGWHRYGATAADRDRFVATVYQSLTGKRS